MFRSVGFFSLYHCLLFQTTSSFRSYIRRTREKERRKPIVFQEMSVTSNTSSLILGRTSSYPTQESLTMDSINQRRSSLTIEPSAFSSIERNLPSNSSWLQRCKQHLGNFFKNVSKPTGQKGKTL